MGKAIHGPASESLLGLTLLQHVLILRKRPFSVPKTPMPQESHAPTYIIAEMANAHEGHLEEALRIVDAAADAGANAVKFQLFSADELAVPAFEHYELYRELAMTPEAWDQVYTRVRERGLDTVADVFGLDSARLAQELGTVAFKVHCADTANAPLLAFLGSCKKRVFLSAGGSTWLEIAEAADMLLDAGASSIVLVFGFQNYPTGLRDSNLQRLSILKERFEFPVGFAPHLDGGDPQAVQLPTLAVAAGASFLEVHLTLDRSRKGLDYSASLNPEPFSRMVQAVRAMEPALGERSLALPPAEVDYRIGHKKSLVATRDLKAGELLSDDDVALKRTADAPLRAPGLSAAIGHRVIRTIRAHEPIFLKDLEMKVAATLACRAESRRLFAKPLQRVGESTILDRVVAYLREATLVDEIVLAISEGPSNALFIDFAEKNHLRYVVGDEKDVLGRLIAAAEFVRADICVRTTTENPFIYSENLDDLIRLHIENSADLSVTQQLPLGSLVEVINLSALQRSHAHGEDRHRSELCTLFIAENPECFEIQRIDPPEALRRPKVRLTVDTPEDLILVRKVIQALESKGVRARVEEVVEFLDANPEIARINQEHTGTLRLF